MSTQGEANNGDGSTPRIVAPPEIDGTDLLNRHAPFDWKERWGITTWDEFGSLLASRKAAFTVVAFDMRKSTLIAKEASSHEAYTEALNEFIFLAWWLVRAMGGFFDKFTGDGFLAYWFHGPQFGGGWSPEQGKPSESLAWVMGVSGWLLRFFEMRTQPELIRIARNWPNGAGCAVGIDGGEGSLHILGNDLAIVGQTVVGASRMVSAAESSEILVNVNIGHRLDQQISEGIWDDTLEAAPVVRFTKEYPRASDGSGGLIALSVKVSDANKIIDEFGGEMTFPYLPGTAPDSPPEEP